MESPSRDIVQDDDISRSVQHWSMFRGSESFPPGSLYLGVPLSPFDSRSSDLNPLSAPLFGLDDNQSDLIGGSRLENASLVADSTRKRPKKPDPEPIPPVPSPVPPPTNPICGTSPEGFGPFAPLSAREDFTPCFEGSVLATIPRAGLVCFVIVVGLGRICSGTRRNRSQSYGDDDENDIVVVRTRDSALWWAKMITSFLLFAIWTAFAAYTVLFQSPRPYPYELLDTIGGALVSLLVIPLSHNLHKSQIRTATSLIFYYLGALLVLGIQLRSYLMTDFLPADPSQRDVLRLGLLSSAVGLTLLAFILENVPKTRHVYLRLSDSEHVTGSVTESPEEVASIWSRLFFSYMNPLMSLGHSKGYLEQSDLPTLNKTEQAHMLSKKFGEVWEQELRKGANASLVRASFKVVGLYFLSAAPLKLMQDLLSFLQPTLLRFLIDFARSHMDTTPKLFGFSFGSADNNTPSKTEPQPVSVGFIIAVVMFVTAIIQSSALHQYFNICYMTGMRLRGALVTQIYRKALRLSSAARQVSTTGEVVNLMAVDAQRIMDLFTYLHILWSGPFQICMALYLLYGTLGYPVFAGVAIMIFAIPLNAYLAKVSRSLQKTQMTTRDVRVKMMDELLSGIKMIKLYAWEGRFVEKISEVRQKEMNTLRQYALLSAIQSFFFAATPFLVAFSTFALHAMLYPQIPLTSTKVFVSLALFNLLQFPLVMFPSVISSSVEASVAFSRLRKFLVNEELDPNAVTFEPFPKNGLPNGAGTIKGNKPYLVEVSQGSFQWGSPTANNSTLTLRSIDLRCQNGSLLAVVGPVGSGKSSLLSALLGDMTRVSGSVVVRGQVAYAAQSPWIMNATLRDNVLFGHAFDQAWYDKVLDACGLRSDLLVLPGGDMVEIGERGINLSGGQKARVSLARAVYANADVYFLDDSLSAVDSHVARHIFDNVIGPKGLLKDKARIFVTHAIAFLADMDEICLIEEGQIVESGTYQQLMASKGELHRLISEFGFGKEADEVREGVPEGDRDLLLDIDGVDDDVAPPIEESHSDLVGSQTISAINPSSTVEKTLSDANLSPETPQRRRSRAASMSVNELQRQQQLERAQSQDLSAECQVVTNGTQPAGNGQASGDSKAKGTLMTKETSARGAVSMSVYRIYAESCGYFAVGVYLVVLFLSQATSVAQTFWLADWSKDNDVEQSGPNGSGWTVSWRIGIYGMLGLLFCITSFIQTVYAWVFCAIRSARVLHKEMLENVVRLPQSWFDTTSMGTVLNRFAKDQNMVDETIPRSFMSFFSTVARVAAVLVVDTIATPLFLLFVTPLAYFYYAVSKYYMATSRELKRLDSVSRSPIYAHFQESLGGVSTIRAFGEQDRFVLENEHRIDLNGRAYSPSIVSNRWLAMRLELVGSVIIFASAMFAVVEIATAGKIDASVVGLSLSYALSMTQSLNWMVRQSNEIETNIVSVERVKEYIDLPQEAPAHIPNAKPPATWPEKGAITFSDYSTRYRPNLDLVLRQISLDIKPGEKIGLCGRTGSGKSTLALALFRIMEPAEGTIAIDGVDISKIGLYDLRSRLTVVPQDPILFQGTIRTNLDPFGEHDDSTLWNALEAAYLKDAVMELDGKLDANVQQGGDNFSQGQRQLLQLSRALLRSTRILILDEASSSVDIETDAQIQATIRREFSKATIFTIAHRINTIIDYDRICVLSNGKVQEFDSPGNLLKDKTSSFYSLAKEAGWSEGK